MSKTPALILALSIALALPAHADNGKKIVKTLDFTKSSPYGSPHAPSPSQTATTAKATSAKTTSSQKKNLATVAESKVSSKTQKTEKKVEKKVAQATNSQAKQKTPSANPSKKSVKKTTQIAAQTAPTQVPKTQTAKIRTQEIKTISGTPTRTALAQTNPTVIQSTDSHHTATPSPLFNTHSTVANTQTSKSLPMAQVVENTRAIPVSSTAKAVSSLNLKAQNTSNIRQSLIASAKKLIGTPYRWGGLTPRGFDCSGLVSYVFKQKGKSLPRTAAAQFASLTAVKKPQPGDLVFFRHRSGRIGHVGLYIGDGKMIHAPQSGQRVRIESIEKPNWKRRYAGARSLLPHAEIQIAENKGSGNVGRRFTVK